VRAHTRDDGRPPSPQLLLVLAGNAADSSEKAELLRLASIDGADDYAKTVVEEQRTLLDILLQFGSVVVALTQVVEHLPRLQPRFYSISSSPRAHKQSVHITAALVEFEKPGEEKGRGYEGSKCEQPIYIPKAEVLRRARPGGDFLAVFLRAECVCVATVVTGHLRRLMQRKDGGVGRPVQVQ